MGVLEVEGGARGGEVRCDQLLKCPSTLIKELTSIDSSCGSDSADTSLFRLSYPCAPFDLALKCLSNNSFIECILHGLRLAHSAPLLTSSPAHAYSESNILLIFGKKHMVLRCLEKGK